MKEEIKVNNSSRKNFESILTAPVKLYKGLILFEFKKFDENEIIKLLQEYGEVDTQKYFNHLHMLQYSLDLNIQRKWAVELIDKTREKVREMWPNYYLIGEMRDDGYDIEVTFWALEIE